MILLIFWKTAMPNTPYPEYKKDVDFCKKIHKKYGKSFYFGTFLFKQKIREATCILYAFFRYPDEYVDTYFYDQKDQARIKLISWQQAWDKTWKGTQVDVDENEARILRAAHYVFLEYHIPYEYSQDFIKAMLQDTVSSEYETYQDLEGYMYGSAAIVGLMMTYVLCKEDPRFSQDEKYRNEILFEAKALGEAFQMTNFLRDISDDFEIRGRIYLPKEDIERFGVTKNVLISKKITPEFVELMKYEITRTNSLYKKADKGIYHLPKGARKGMRIARKLYSHILLKIEKKGYDIFRERVHVSFLEKLFIMVKSL